MNRKNIFVATVLTVMLSFTGCKPIINLLSKFGDEAAKHGDEVTEVIDKAVKNADTGAVKSAGGDLVEKAIDAAGAAKDISEEVTDDRK